MWFLLRMWLSGRASPCQGEGREFESRHPLAGHCRKSVRGITVQCSKCCTELWISGPKYGGVAERRGSGLQSRVHGFESRSHLHFTAVNRFQQVFLVLIWAIGAAVARFPDTEEVTGSIPVSPTTVSSFVMKLLFCCLVTGPIGWNLYRPEPVLAGILGSIGICA